MALPTASWVLTNEIRIDSTHFQRDIEKNVSMKHARPTCATKYQMTFRIML